jgi:hypothetical protein
VSAESDELLPDIDTAEQGNEGVPEKGLRGAGLFDDVVDQSYSA